MAVARTLAVVVLVLGGCVRAGFQGLGGVDGGPDCATRMLSVLADSDDGEIDYDGTHLPRGEPGPSWEPSNDPDGIFIGHWIDLKTSIEGPTRGYFRFRLTEAIPAQATVSGADFTLRGLDAPGSSADWNPAIHALRVRGEDAADAPAVTSGKVPAMLPQSVRWPAQGGLAWQANGDNSVDVAPLLRALVQKRAGLAPGARVQLWVWGDFADASAEVATPDLGRPGAVPARLEIRWCE